ncbi:hypothetical protein RSOLAG22IIIB_05536 [Rhizoctonia solani]|uniref:Uncharacterized protein n=1 Tax=Rhizoctonia solani TaxID=456999 RepID=A0A0K6G734_9AGAM|nr:hypothetical protein RSOLAG22IIIB_05536 [Rhizoctonia solani]
MITRATQQGVEGSTSIEERHLSTLPAFTPFPAAAPSSRYAPPPDSRAEPMRPVLPPIVYSQDPSSGPWIYEQPTNLVGESSTPVVRYPSGIPPGRPSPFAPPGPLTARPHRLTRETDLTNVPIAKDRLAVRMLCNAILSLQNVVLQATESYTLCPEREQVA